MKKILIFDMDGVLLDSMPLWEHLGVGYLTAHGIQPTPGLRERLLQMTMPEAAALFRTEFGMTDSAEKIISGIDAMAEEFYTVKAPLKPGVAETLAVLHRRGYCCVLATATDRDLAQAALSRTGIAEYFQQIFTCTELNLSKKDPEFFRHILNALQVTPEKCAVIEDALHAIQTALSCGIDTYALYDESAREVWPQIQSIATRAFLRFDQLLEVL
ncbi:MAG: HAD family phosphatase [Victivallales bacterium]|nr:HAD family phosphatase [Victivallales bacterium]